MQFPLQFAFEFPALEMHFGIWYGRELSVWARFAGPLVRAISVIVVFTRYFLGPTYIVGGMSDGDVPRRVKGPALPDAHLLDLAIWRERTGGAGLRSTRPYDDHPVGAVAWVVWRSVVERTASA